MKHCCKNCHFLIKQSEQLSLQPWTKEDRDDTFPRMRIPPGEVQHEQWSPTAAYDIRIGCYKEVWSDTHNEFSHDESIFRRVLHEKIVENRANKCFFVDYHEGMSMENAEELFSLRNVFQQNYQRIKSAQIASGIAILVSLLALGWQVFEAVFLNIDTFKP